MITTAPLPTLRDLAVLAAGRGGTAPDRFASPWDAPGATTHWFSRGAWALAALAAGLAEGRTAPLRIWLPGHICDQSLEPLRRRAVRLFFYPVDGDARPDWDVCAALARDGGGPDLFVLVHPFGLGNDVAGGRAFADAHGALLIEDAAHVLRPGGGIGATGEATLYCPHKLLALPHGSALVCRAAHLDAVIVRGRDLLPEATPPVRPWIMRRAAQRLLPEALLRALRPAAPPAFDADPAAERLPDTPRLAAAVVPLLRDAGDRLDEIAARRRQAAALLYDEAARHPGWTPFQPGGVMAEAPYRAVLRCATEDLARDRFTRLRRAGFLAETWPDLPPEVRADPARHAGAIDLRRRLLLLPVDNGPSPEALAAALRVALV